jgi:hypothetical protein
MIALNFARCASIAGAALLLMATACGNVETPSGGGGQGGTTSSSSTTTTTTTTTTGGGGASGGTCGGIAGTPCPADEWCDFGDNRCGGNDNGGVCVKRPVGCEKNLLPTCGCDNQIHDNECDAHKAGVDVNDSGFCKAPAGMFACGAHFCTLGSYYCQVTGSDVGGTPDSFQCAALPAGCGAMPTCACLDPGFCGGTCSATPDGGLKIFCPGG